MPITRLVAFQTARGRVPILEWIDALPARVRRWCHARLLLAASFGRELRRPVADYLRDGIYELRVRHHRDHYRMLSFFSGRDEIVLTHGFVKRDASVPSREIERALLAKQAFLADPERHTHETEVG